MYSKAYLKITNCDFPRPYQVTAHRVPLFRQFQSKEMMSSSAESEHERLSSMSSPQRRPVLARSTSYGAHDKMFAAASASGVTTAGLSAAPTPRHGHGRQKSFSAYRTMCA